MLAVESQPNLPGADVDRWIRTPAAWATELHGGGHGTVSIGRASSTGGVYQRRYRVEEAQGRLRAAEGQADVYMSMARFGGGLGTENLVALTALYVDLDFYDIPELAGQHPYMVAEAAIDHLRRRGFPAPTHTISSGRGGYLIWQFDPIRPSALPKWRAAARELAEALRSFGADQGASTDAARILRIPGSVNSKNGARVEPLMPAGETYQFGPLCDAILPISRAEWAARQLRRGPRDVAASGPGSAPEGYGAGTLGTAYLDDLQALRRADLRGPDLRGPDKQPDHRRRWCQYAAAALGFAAPSPERAREEARRLAGEVAGWSVREADSRLGTTFKKTEAAHRGETIQYRGHQVDPRYRYRAETIVEDLQITPAEQRHMKVLIGPEERRRRRRQKAEVRRRAAGSLPREDYEGRAAHRLREAHRLAGEGHGATAIAQTLGVTRQHVHRLLRETVPPQERLPKEPNPEAPSEGVTSAYRCMCPSGAAPADTRPHEGRKVEEGIARQLFPGEDRTSDISGRRPGRRPELGEDLGSERDGVRDDDPGKAWVRGAAIPPVSSGSNLGVEVSRQDVHRGQPDNDPSEVISIRRKTVSSGEYGTISDRDERSRATGAHRAEGGSPRGTSATLAEVAPPADPAEAHVRELYRCIHTDQPVQTPGGRGRVWQAFSDRIGVVLHHQPGRVEFYEPVEVKL